MSTRRISMTHNPLYVLALDDEPDQLEILKFFLEESDRTISVDTLDDPKNALQRIQEKHYDCILSDYIMPGIDGIELNRRIKEVKDIPFILYTGRGSEAAVLEAFANGIDGYIRKEPGPDHYLDIVRQIRRAIEKRPKRPDDQDADASLPEYPKTEVRGRMVFILYEDGGEQFWSEEPEEVKAYQIAEEIQIGLRSRHFVRERLFEYMNSLMERMLELNVPGEEIEGIIFDGYRSLYKIFKSLWDAQKT